MCATSDDLARGDSDAVDHLILHKEPGQTLKDLNVYGYQVRFFTEKTSEKKRALAWFPEKNSGDHYIPLYHGLSLTYFCVYIAMLSMSVYSIYIFCFCFNSFVCVPVYLIEFLMFYLCVFYLLEFLILFALRSIYSLCFFWFFI